MALYRIHPDMAELLAAKAAQPKRKGAGRGRKAATGGGRAKAKRGAKSQPDAPAGGAP